MSRWEQSQRLLDRLLLQIAKGFCKSAMQEMAPLGE
jgi:hypothetical protein